MATPRILPIHLMFNQKPGDVPDACWKWVESRVGLMHVWMMRLLVVSAAGWFLWCIIVNPMPSFEMIPVLVLCAYTIVIEVLVDRAVVELNKRLESANCHLCRECAYDLSGLPEAHQCPECGCAYIAEELRLYWEPWLAKFRKPTRKWFHRS